MQGVFTESCGLISTDVVWVRYTWLPWASSLNLVRGYPTGHRIPKNLLFSESEGTDEVQAILCITAPQKTQVNERQP